MHKWNKFELFVFALPCKLAFWDNNTSDNFLWIIIIWQLPFFLVLQRTLPSTIAAFAFCLFTLIFCSRNDCPRSRMRVFLNTLRSIRLFVLEWLFKCWVSKCIQIICVIVSFNNRWQVFYFLFCLQLFSGLLISIEGRFRQIPNIFAINL